MKKLKVSLIAIALIIGGVQAYGGMRFTTYYCVAGTSQDATYFTVASTSPAVGCVGGLIAPFVCSFSAAGGHNPGYSFPANAISITTTYDN